MCPYDLELPCYQFNNSCSVPVQCNSNRRTPYGEIPSKDISRKVVVSERVLTIRTSISHYSALSRRISQFWISSCHTGLHLEMTCDCSPRLSQLQHSWCNTQVVKRNKVTLNIFDVYLLPPVAYADRKKRSRKWRTRLLHLGEKARQ